MAENFHRLVCFVVNICPLPLRGLFLKYAKLESGATFTTLEAYLGKKKKTINHLHNKRKIRDDQFDLIYPPLGRTVSESEWDVTLLVTLITELFSTNLQGYETFVMNEIREIRNKLQHIPNTSRLSENDYSYYWTRLEIATLSLAKNVGGSDYENEMAERISNTKVINLPYLVESLRVWYEENKKQMSEKIEEMTKTMKKMTKTMKKMRKKMTDMKAKVEDTNFHTKRTVSTLESVTVENVGPEGRPVKRVRVENITLQRLKASYDKTMKTELGRDFSPPPEVDEIQARLRDKHHVVVTGSDGSRYVEAALAAVKGMEYIPSRCVEMLTSTDWHHIDPEDVDFVLCRDPFGASYYDEKKAESMADNIFDSMLYTTMEKDNDKRIDIVFVTNISFLTEFKHRYKSEILEEVVTTENQSVDLTSGSMVPHTVTQNNSKVAAAFIHESRSKDITELYLQKHAEGSKLVNADTLKLAKTEFKKYKMVVITGPKRCGKDSLAISLIETCCLKTRCIVLRNPDDFRFIDLKNPCLVIVEEFAGIYRYEEDDVYEWYKTFDLLYDASKAGKVNVIVTCEKEKLDKCCREILEHKLLKHRVDLSDNIFVVKDEIIEDIASCDSECDANGSMPQGSQLSEIQVKVEDPNECTVSIWENNLKDNDDNGDMRSTMKEPDGTVTLPYRQNHAISHNPFAQEESNSRMNWDSLQPSIGKIEPVPDVRLTDMWSVASRQTYDISMVKEDVCSIRGCCQLPSGESLLVDQVNFRLKKLDTRFQVIAVCKFQDVPIGVCYIDNNEAVVTVSTNLMFIDVVNMTITRSVNTEHECAGLACHGNLLYVVGRDCVYMYSTDGIKQRVLYTSIDHCPLLSANIAVSADSSKIYILNRQTFTTVDNSCDHLYTFKDPRLSFLGGLCVDGEGHAFVSAKWPGSILQISSDGRHILGNVAGTHCRQGVRTMHFDRQNSMLMCAGYSNTLTVFQLNKLV